VDGAGDHGHRTFVDTEGWTRSKAGVKCAIVTIGSALVRSDSRSAATVASLTSAVNNKHHHTDIKG
jgi:hypothetical protein